MSAKIKLPVSSLPEIEKIIQGYAHHGENVSLEALSKLLGIGTDTITRNNPFLVSVGVIEKGIRKTPTGLGKQLGRALQHNREEEVKRLWRQVVGDTDFLTNLPSTVRLKGGMKSSDLAGHILYAADQSDNRRTRTGANAIVDILKRAGMVTEDAGVLRVAVNSDQGESPAPREGSTPDTPISQEVVNANAGFARKFGSLVPQVTFNIQIVIPENASPETYDAIFASIASHLLRTSEDE